MIRQSLVDERVSALHLHALQSTGDNDNDISKASSRRVPAPVASRIVITKNASLISTGDELNINSSSSPTPSPTPMVDPRSRVELLERNLRYVQQQHEITLVDLHNEISRLQKENRDLHFRMIDLNPSTSSSNPVETTPTINQLVNLTQNEPILEKRLQEVQRLHFEQEINELRMRLVETEQKNEYLIRTIDELNKSKSVHTPIPVETDIVPVLLPDPNTTIEAELSTSIDRIHTNEDDYQQLLKISTEKQRQHLQEITRLRAVLREILNTERLSSTSKILIRDCLTSETINENIHTMTTTPTDGHYSTSHPQQRSIASSSTGGKNLLYRQTNGPNRPTEQRLVLPPIIQPNSASLSSTHDPTGVTGLLHSSLSQVNAGTQQQLLKIGETPIARRERRTQELQRTRLTKNLYH